MITVIPDTQDDEQSVAIERISTTVIDESDNAMFASDDAGNILIISSLFVNQRNIHS